MQQEGGAWKISMDILPTWIMDAEEELSRAIEEENQTAIAKDRK